MDSDERLQLAIERFNQLNARDPQQIVVSESGSPVLRPRELVQAERLEAWILRLAPDASVPLRLAARCQHLERWKYPRSDYPEGRIGYLKWRKELARLHAERATEILRDVGFEEDVIEAVRLINLKQGIKSNSETQLMEDALCLAFLEHEFAEFATKYDDAKVIDIVQKTWRKMSDRAHEEALKLELPPAALQLVQRALSAADPSTSSEP